MTTTFDIDAARRVVVITPDRDADDEEILAIYERLRDDPSIEPDFALLLDVRQSAGDKVTFAGLHRIAQLPLVLSPEARRAFVVSSDFAYGMARMYQVFRGVEGAPAVFVDIAEARRWVGLDTDR